MSVARLAWFFWAFSAALGALMVLFYFLSFSISLEGRDRPPPEFLPVLLIAVLAFSTVGALVASRRPANAVGWIFCAVGAFLGAAFLAQFYADYALIGEPGSLPGAEIMVWSLSWSGPILFMAPAFLLLLFPDGRLPSRRWRPVVWLAVGGTAMNVLGLAFRPGTLDDDYPLVTNPFGVGGAPGEALSLMSGAGGALVTVALSLSLVAMILRLRRSRGEELQQLKWIVYAGGIMVVAFLAGFAVPGTGLIGDLIWAIGFGALVGIPIAAGIAILKYRLYDIDLVINRTLVYGLLTISLAATYLGSVVVLQTIFRALSGQDSQLAVVASTLAIAALFSPLRRQLQTFIDRRFYRKKYDAAQVLSAFSATLRDETDLDRLSGELVSVVRETMQPEHVSLWLKSGGAQQLRSVGDSGRGKEG